MEKITDFIPTYNDVVDLNVGSLAVDCFGRKRKVSQIIYRGVDKDGKHYVGFMTEFNSGGGRISGSYKEDQRVQTVFK